MVDGDDERATVSAAMEKARQMVPPDQLRDALLSPDLDHRVQEYVRLYNALGRSLPVSLVDNAVLKGLPRNRDQLFQELEKSLRIKPVK